MSSESEVDPPSEPKESSKTARVPILNDETIEESRLSKIIEESTRRGFEASKRQGADKSYQLSNKPRKRELGPVTTQPIAEIVSVKLPLYKSNFGFMHLIKDRSFKALLALFVIVFGIIGMLWAFNSLWNLVMKMFKADSTIDLVGYGLPYIWIPIVIFVYFAIVVMIKEIFTKLYTTDTGYLIYERPTIVPLLIFGSRRRVKISQIGAIDEQPEHFLFVVFKTKRVKVDSPSDESKDFDDMRGVKYFDLLKKALGQ